MADFSALKTSIQNYIKQNGNEEITGNLLQQILLSMVSTLGDSAINDLVIALNAEIANRGNADTELGGRITTLQGVVNGIKANVENGYVYAGIATPSTTPASGKVFYLALTAGTYTNFGATVVPQGINILKYNGSAWSLDSFLGLDDAPTQGSNNLVKSGSVLDSIIKNGSAFDLSAYNNGTTYADLSAALTALNALPAAYKKGGMSMKFVQTSDNKYVQYRLMADSWSINTNDWALDECSYITNDTVYAKAITDILSNILLGIMRDGTIYQYKAYIELLQAINAKIKELTTDKLNLPTTEISAIENNEWLRILCDNDYNIFSGFSKNGKLFANIDYSVINTQIKNINNEISYLSKKQQVMPPITLKHLSVVSRKDEWNNYRMQGMTLDYIHGYFFLAGNLRGTDNTTKIIKTSDLINFSDAVYIEGEYGHANDLTYNENTNCIYVAGGTGKNGSYNNTIYVFNAETLELVDEIEITELSDVINIDYNAYNDTYIIGDYNNGNIYDSEFNLLKRNVIPLSEKVIDAYFDIPGSKTAAQGIISYRGITYKFYSAQLVSPVYDCGVLAAFDEYSRIMDVRIVTAPNLFKNELESVAIDPIKKKLYCCWDGDTISFSESYIDFSASELPRTIIAEENLNHILGYGMYAARNAAIAESIAELENHGYPINIMGEQRHGFSIEVKPVSHGSLVQIFRSFKEYENDEPVAIVPVAATRMAYGVTESGVTSYKFTEWVENINV